MKGHIRERSPGHWAIILDGFIRSASEWCRRCPKAEIEGGKS
jgi:hypothetical protein